MKFLSSAILSMSLATTAFASPLEGRQVQTAHLTFHGGPASYELAVPADGRLVPTSKILPYHAIPHLVSSHREKVVCGDKKITQNQT